MKKLFYLLASLSALTFASCEKSTLQDISGAVSGDEMSISVNLGTTDGTTSRSSDDDVLVYYLQAYYQGEFFRDFGTSTNGQFEINLVSDKDFTLVAWADYNKGYYNTDSLHKVSLTDAPIINSDDRDAFAGALEIYVDALTTVQMVLQRPFGRINVYSNDMALVEGTVLQPTKVNLTYTSAIFTTFDVLNSAPTVETENLSYTASIGSMDDDGNVLVSFDYLFAPEIGADADSKIGDVANFNLECVAESGEVVVSYNVANIPFYRNYQTNATGSIFTDGFIVEITVNDVWEEPDVEVDLDAEVEFTAEIEILDITNNSATISWTVSDESVDYVYGLFSGVSGYDDETLMAAIISYYNSYGVLDSYTHSGNVSTTYGSLDALTEYAMCIFTVDEAGTAATSDLSKAAFTTLEGTTDDSWLGTWNLTSTSLSDTGAPVTVEIIISESATSGYYDIWGFDLTTGRNMFAMPAAYDETTGGWVVSGSNTVGTYGSYTMMYCGYAYISSYGAYYIITGTYDALIASAIADGKATIACGSGVVSGSLAFDVATVRLFAYANNSYANFYNDTEGIPGISDSDFMIGPYTLEKVSDDVPVGAITPGAPAAGPVLFENGEVALQAELKPIAWSL